MISILDTAKSSCQLQSAVATLTTGHEHDAAAVYTKKLERGQNY